LIVGHPLGAVSLIAEVAYPQWVDRMDREDFQELVIGSPEILAIARTALLRSIADFAKRDDRDKLAALAEAVQTYIHKVETYQKKFLEVSGLPSIDPDYLDGHRERLFSLQVKK
jgi:hypothetical protein